MRFFAGLPLAVGLIAAVIALDQRHTGDAFSADQRPVQAFDQRRAVERLVATAPAPSTPATNGKASASCQPGTAGVLRNPWRCTLRYRSGLSVPYVVTVRSDGSYFGRGPTARNGLTDTIHGCCLRSP
jgi:hypothetical protein